MSDKIRIATSNPDLKDKLTIDITEDSTDIFWYIRFNIPLDEDTVSEKTMDVTDTYGYIMRTDISYNKLRNMIIISPIDSYEENIYYLLNISTKVCSQRGQNLKSKIHILFKLYNSQISEFKVLRKEVSIPKPKQRPSDYDKKITAAKLLQIGEELYKNKSPYDLPYKMVKANIIPAIVGTLLFSFYFLKHSPLILIVSAVFCLLGMGLLILSLTKKEQRSMINYNLGVFNFNKERYSTALEFFNKALEIDPENDVALYAVNKMKFYS